MLPSNITGLIAHPDDEVLFCWPMLERAKRVVAVVSDANNPERAWCSKRKDAFLEVAQLYGFEPICLDYNSCFYKAPTRDKTLMHIVEDVLANIPPGPIFTHNQFGEYGHIDHMIVHQLAVSTNQPVYFTDIVMEVNWMPFKIFPAHSPYTYDGTYERDCAKFAEAELIYRNHGCCTWSRPTPNVCGVYKV